MLSEERICRRGMLNPSVVTQMIRDNETREKDYTLQLSGLLTLELWHQVSRERQFSQNKFQREQCVFADAAG
jgi:hypothetical protein